MAEASPEKGWVLPQPLPGGIQGRLSSVGGVGLVEDAADVAGHRVKADDQLFGDLRIALAQGNQAQHFHLPLGQPVGL